MKKNYVLVLLFFAFISNSFGQVNSVCTGAKPFCEGDRGLTFTNTTNSGTAAAGVDYGCLFTQPNPSWYYLRISRAGNLILKITQTTGPTTTPPNQVLDVDFIAWGPFGNAPTCGGTNLTPATQVPNPVPHVYPTPGGCSYDGRSIEFLAINNAQVNEYYMVLMTNFSNRAGE